MRIIVTGADGALGIVVVDRLRCIGSQVVALCGTEPVDTVSAMNLPSGDLADERNANHVFTIAIELLGGLDALVHLAGGFVWGEVAATPLAVWRRMFDMNIGTAVASIGATLPHITPGGSIVLVGAASAQPATAGFGPYGAAKAGVARLTEALAAELRPRGVRVNAVLPSIIDTPRNQLEMPDADFATWTSPGTIADTIAFLVSSQARAVSGALIPVTNAA